MAKERFVPEVITLPNIRVAFFRGYHAQARTGRDGKPNGKPKYSMTALLDPSNAEHVVAIKKIKDEALRALLHRYESRENFPRANKATGIGGLIMCFGEGNDLPKVYDGYKDMFYIKLTDTERPMIANRAGKLVDEGQPEAPYSGCIGIARTTLYSYSNESSGVNANFRSLQFVAPGQAFSGRGALDPSQEFTPLGGSGGVQAQQGSTEKDPWDDDIPF